MPVPNRRSLNPERRAHVSAAELRIYTALIKDPTPRVRMDLAREIDVPDGTVYPIIDKLVGIGVLALDSTVQPPTVSINRTPESLEFIASELRYVQLLPGVVDLLVQNSLSPSEALG